MMTTRTSRRDFLKAAGTTSALMTLHPNASPWLGAASGDTWPTAVAVDPAGRYLLILNAWDSSISLFELPGRRLLATIPLGIALSTTDRLPDLAVDFSRGRAYVGYPEFGVVAVVDWMNRRALTPMTIADFAVGDVGGGPNQLQVVLSESSGRLLVLAQALRRLECYDITGDPVLLTQSQVAFTTQGGERVAWKTLFIDPARERAFVGAEAFDVRTGRAIGVRAERGQRIFAIDETRSAYWAALIENEQLSVVTLDRASLALVDSQLLGAVDYVAPDLALDLSRGRLYVTHLAAAEIDVYQLE
jgi:hypothetical protein